MYVCLLLKFEGVLRCLFIIELACETQSQNTIYKSFNTKDKSKKLKVKTQKAKDTFLKTKFKTQKAKHKDEVKGPKIQFKPIQKIKKEHI